MTIKYQLEEIHSLIVSHYKLKLMHKKEKGEVGRCEGPGVWGDV